MGNPRCGRSRPVGNRHPKVTCTPPKHHARTSCVHNHRNPPYPHPPWPLMIPPKRWSTPRLCSSKQDCRRRCPAMGRLASCEGMASCEGNPEPLDDCASATATNSLSSSLLSCRVPAGPHPAPVCVPEGSVLGCCCCTRPWGWAQGGLRVGRRESRSRSGLVLGLGLESRLVVVPGRGTGLTAGVQGQDQGQAKFSG